MTMKTLLGAAAFSLALAVPAANAATFTVNGQDYDISTVTGTFDNLDSMGLLSDQIWFRDETLALDFAVAVGFTLGSPNSSGDDGPYFAYMGSGPALFTATVTSFFDPAEPALINRVIISTEEATYAIATPLSAVPLPAGGLLMLSGLAGIAAFKRRKKHTA